MDDFLDAPFPAIRGQALDLIRIEEEIVFPQDGRLMHLRNLGLPVELVFEPVLHNPDEYLMARYAPFVELDDDWEAFSGNNYLGLQQHQEEDDLDDDGETMDCKKTSSQDDDTTPSASQHVTKRDDSPTDDCRLLKDIGPSSSCFATIGLLDASPAAFGPILE